MAQVGNTYTGKFKDIPSYLGQNHIYFAYDTKELYGFELDKTPYPLFRQDNELNVITIQASDLPLMYTKEDVVNYLNTNGFDKEDIETLAIEIVGGEEIGGLYPIDWGFIADKPITFPPSEHTHSYNDLTDLPDLSNIGGMSEDEVQTIIRNFLVEGTGIDLVYDSTLDVLRFNTTNANQDNVNIVLTINREILSSVDEAGVVQYLNTMHPPLLIEGHHNLYIKISETGSTQFEYNLDFNLA